MVILGFVVVIVVSRVDFLVFGKFIRFILVSIFSFSICYIFLFFFLGWVYLGVWFVEVLKLVFFRFSWLLGIMMCFLLCLVILNNIFWVFGFFMIILSGIFRMMFLLLVLEWLFKLLLLLWLVFMCLWYLKVSSV